MSNSVVTPTIYVKPGCPWCDEVIEYFEQHRLPYEEISVTGNREAMQEMIDLSGQTKAPTMNWDGEILADFGVDELVPFLKKRGVVVK